MRTNGDAVRGLISQARHTMDGDLPGSPCTYGIFISDIDTEMYGPLASAHWPIYVGSTTDLSRRIKEHHRSLEHINSIELGQVSVSFVEASQRAEAGFVESLIIDRYPIVWNKSRFNGFGSKPQGRLRTAGQQPTKWDRIHPGRPWTQSDRAPDENLRLEVADFVGTETPKVCGCTKVPAHPEVLLEPGGDLAPWHINNTTRRAHGSVCRAVTGLLGRYPDRVWKSGQVANELDLSANHASTVLSRLTKDGAVYRIARGVYAASPRSEPVAHQRLDVVSTLSNGTAVCTSDGTVWLAHQLDIAA